MRIQKKAILLGSDAGESFASVVMPDCVMGNNNISNVDLKNLLAAPLARENGLHVNGSVPIYGMAKPIRNRYSNNLPRNLRIENHPRANGRNLNK